jgi:hypothetical protein
MNIKHYSITNYPKVEEIYSEKDGVPVKYVCTTEFTNDVSFIGGALIADVFYRSTPHPTFGNKYFAVFFRGDKPYIANADTVEDLTFGMIENDEGGLEYSRGC